MRFLVLGGVAVLVGLGVAAVNAKQLGIDVPWAETSGSFLSKESSSAPTDGPNEGAEESKQLAALAAEADACAARISEARTAPGLPGAPKLEERRARLLARAKAEPVLFMTEPQYTGEVSPGTAGRRQALLTTKYPRDVFRKTIGTFRDFPVRLRELLLRDGYLYTDDPRAGRLLTQNLKLDLLFHEKEIMVQRGALTFEAKKGEDGLFYVASGPEKGKRARLLLFDRVWLPGQEPGPAVHVDVRELAQREGIDGMRISRLTDKAIVAEVRLMDEWVPALIEREGVNLTLGCLQIAPERASDVGSARDMAYRRALVLKALRSAITQQVELGLPFDEPRTERGQQDGKLRARWEKAYKNGDKAYKFNGDLYQVFNSAGAPMTPQVCIDFVTETLERASGMHFNEEGKKPEKVLGALDFDEILGDNRRKELAIRNYARQSPKQLKMIDYPVSSWVRYEKVDAFFAFVENERDEMRPGDIVIIRGRAAWDRYEEVHTHTFFVYEADPITGMPTLLAGNSGKPRIVTWDGEMLRAPKRSIRHRIRPDTEWLYDHVVLRRPLRGERWAAPLTVAEDR